jgi:hypothetical protein
VDGRQELAVHLQGGDAPLQEVRDWIAVPPSARELPSSSEWFGVARRGEHLLVLRLRAIGTADWTPQFVDLTEAAADAAPGLD